jgi:hypothetical protein
MSDRKSMPWKVGQLVTAFSRESIQALTIEKVGAIHAITNDGQKWDRCGRVVPRRSAFYSTHIEPRTPEHDRRIATIRALRNLDNALDKVTRRLRNGGLRGTVTTFEDITTQLLAMLPEAAA